jgi:NitT/TauT family transport system permease protein
MADVGITSSEEEALIPTLVGPLADEFGGLEAETPKRKFRFPWRMSGRRLLLFGIQILMVAIVVLLWQYAGTTSATQKLVISTPVNVAKYIWYFITGQTGVAHTINGQPTIGSWNDMWVTLQQAAGGYVLGIGSGIIVAVIVASSRWLRLFSAPFVSIGNAIPKIALIPLFILIFGSNYKSTVYFIATGIFFIAFYNVYNGIRSIDTLYLKNASALGANRRWLAREVYMPSIVGWLAASLRLCAAFSIAGAVLCEYFSSQQGMGYIIYTAYESASISVVIGAMLLVAFMALLIDRIVVRVQRHYSRWRLR